MLFKIRFNKNSSDGYSNLHQHKDSLLLRYQRHRQEEGGDTGLSSQTTGRENNDIIQQVNDRRRAAIRSTFICIFTVGILLFVVGLFVLLTGLFSPIEKHDNTPWLVIGSICIVLGIFLLSIEIILRLKKISVSYEVEQPDSAVSERDGSRQNCGRISDTDIESTKCVVPSFKPLDSENT